VPSAKLAGETVYVHLLKDEARVTAVFEFEEWITRDAKLVYFPLFASDPADPVKVLARTGFELEISGKKLGIALPCEAPKRFQKMAGSLRVCWFVANLDDLVEDADVDLSRRMTIRVSYSQPLIGGCFYYLPVIMGLEKQKRSWRYQMLARSGLRVTEVVSKGTDYEQIADSVVVYLKDGETVAIK
jgi:hypothetical protein